MRNERHLTKNELAEQYSVSVRTVSNWMQLGMPRIYLGRRLVRFDLDLVENFFAAFER